MIRNEVIVINQLGLHARAAARFVHLAGQFKSQINVTRGRRTVDGKSILGLLLLAASRGSTLVVTVDGPDEAPAASAIVGLVGRGFEES